MTIYDCLGKPPHRLSIDNPLLLASVHLPPAVSIPMALAAAAWIVWYWFRFGRNDVPPSRRKIRRTSIIIMLVSLPMFVRALSFVDPQVQQREYIRTWMLAMLVLLMVMATAGIDALNNLRLHQRHRHDALRDAALELARQIKTRRQASLAPSHPEATDNGKPKDASS